LIRPVISFERFGQHRNAMAANRPHANSNQIGRAGVLTKLRLSWPLRANLSSKRTAPTLCDQRDLRLFKVD
jgi:hypothetical protein